MNINMRQINKWKAVGVLTATSMFLHNCNNGEHQPTPFQGRVMRVHVPFKPEAGWVKFTPTNKVHFSDGGKDYIYNIGGATVETPLPPTGFNPLTATTSQLEQYGFPLPPSTSQSVAYAQWVKFVSSMDIVDNTTEYQTQDHNYAPCGSKCYESALTNHYGYSIIVSRLTKTGYNRSPVYPPQENNQGEYISNITAEYTQVKANPTPCGNPAESSWISFGGYGGNSYESSSGWPLTQIGSEVRPGGRIVPFLEFISDNGTDSAALTLPIQDNPGDKMSAYMAYMPKVNKIAFILSDQSKTYKNGGHPTVVRLLDNADNQSNPGLNYFYPYGASVSIEAPVINKYPFYSGRRPMVDFGTEYFTNANVGLRINNKVMWKSIGDLGKKLGTFTSFEGKSSLNDNIQVNITQLQGKYHNAFSGKWLHC